MSDKKNIEAVLKFWCDDLGQDHWFKADEDLDAEIEKRFGKLHMEAAGGKLRHWRDTPEGALALTILLDQFSRNLHRGSARAFAHDEKAREVAIGAINRGFDKEVARDRRLLFYLPLMHSEDLADQRRCVQLLEQDENFHALKYAMEHLDIIQRFGRFPARNAALHRQNTRAEQAWLEETGQAEEEF